MDLCNPREVRALLDRYGLAPQKGFGQNFLINPDIPERIAESSYNAVRSRPCAALEIGPGIGALTSSLCERFDRVVAVRLRSERRYRRNRFLRFYRQPVRIASAAPGMAVSALTILSKFRKL